MPELVDGHDMQSVGMGVRPAPGGEDDSGGGINEEAFEQVLAHTRELALRQRPDRQGVQPPWEGLRGCRQRVLTRGPGDDRSTGSLPPRLGRALIASRI